MEKDIIEQKKNEIISSIYKNNTPEIAEKKTGLKKKVDKRKSLPQLFKKGQSGNPNGRPKGVKNFTTLIKEELKKISKKTGVSYDRLLAQRFIKQALSGDTAMGKHIWDHLDGRPTQKIEQDTNLIGVLGVAQIDNNLKENIDEALDNI